MPPECSASLRDLCAVAVVVAGLAEAEAEEDEMGGMVIVSFCRCCDEGY
jgi:hypothetical protein